jgi:hypothetical protein
MRHLLLVTTALLLCGPVSAQADAATLRAAQAPHRDITFHDTLRPNGHHRSLAVANANANSCYASTGTSREHNPTQTFKDCMDAQGFRWMSTTDVGGAPTKQLASRLPKGSFIDPETGGVCTIRVGPRSATVVQRSAMMRGHRPPNRRPMNRLNNNPRTLQI